MKFTLLTVAALFASTDAFSASVSIMLASTNDGTRQQAFNLIYSVNTGAPTGIRLFFYSRLHDCILTCNVLLPPARVLSYSATRPLE